MQYRLHRQVAFDRTNRNAYLRAGRFSEERPNMRAVAIPWTIRRWKAGCPRQRPFIRYERNIRPPAMEPRFRTSRIRYYWTVQSNGYTPYIARHLKPRSGPVFAGGRCFFLVAAIRKLRFG